MSLVTAAGRQVRADLESQVLATAEALSRHGVTPGDRVLLAGGNTPGLVTALLALMHLDASVVLVDERQPPEAYRRQLRLTRARLLICTSPPDVGPETACLTHTDLATARAAAAAPAGVVSFDAWRARADALITWSSGTRGAPKGVVRSGRALLDLIEATRTRMAYRTDDVLLPLVPLTHFYGLTLVLLWWQVGCELVLTPLERLDQALRLAGEVGATVVDGTPSSYYSILNLAARLPGLRSSLARVRMWCSGGSPLSTTIAERFAAEFGLPLVDGYGSNEAGNVALATPANPVHCGRPLPGVEVRVVDSQGRDQPPGQLGEVIVHTPFLMTGYLTEDGTVETRSGTEYRTDDIGFLDGDGNLAVVGRKLAVHRLGHTLYPEAIERRAEECGHPVKIVPLHDDRLGSRLVCVVADAQRRGTRYWRREIDRLLPPHEQPNQVLVVDEFPLTRNGKPDLAALRAHAARGGRRSRGSGAAPPVARVVEAPAGADAVIAGRQGALDAVLGYLRHDPGPVIEILTEVALRRSVDMEIEDAIHTLAGAVEEVRANRPQRVPQLAVFMPSNLLLYSYVLHALVPSLFTERVMLRPSSQVAEQTRRLHRLLAPVHGLPVTLVESAQREFVEGPVRESDVISFTGSYVNAERVRGTLRRDQLFLFFGQGINPFVVGPDADLDSAADDLIRIRLLNSGQDCFGPDVCLVHRPRLEPFVEVLTKRLADLRFGRCDDPTADYGPLWYSGALQTALEYLFRQRRFIVRGGRVDVRERHVQPTVLVRDVDDGLAIEEFFSPLFNVVAYPDGRRLEQVLTSPFFEERAMGAMVYGVDDALVQRLARRHTVAVEATLIEIDDGNQPFGGRGIMANYASTGGERVAEPLLISKAVAEYRGGR